MSLVNQFIRKGFIFRGEDGCCDGYMFNDTLGECTGKLEWKDYLNAIESKDLFPFCIKLKFNLSECISVNCILKEMLDLCNTQLLSWQCFNSYM